MRKLSEYGFALFFIAALFSQSEVAAENTARLTLAPAAELPRAPLAIDGPEGLVELPGVRDQLRGIAAELMAAAEPTTASVSPDIFITTQSHGAMATTSGDIFVGIGLLVDFYSNYAPDDRTAFVLAHELAHLQHDHLANERSANDLDSAVRRFLGLLGAAQELVAEMKNSGLALSPEDGESLDQGVAALIASVKALQALQTGILLPAFNREEELEADAVALETMWRAGFNPDQAKLAVRDLSIAQTVVYEQAADAIRSAANAAKIILRVGKKYQEGIGSNILPFDPTDLLVDLVGEGAVAAFCEFSASHPTAEDRVEAIDKLMEANPKYKRSGYRTSFSSYLGSDESGLAVKVTDLNAARDIENGLEDALIRQNPLRTNEGCGEENDKSAGEKLGEKYGGIIESLVTSVLPVPSKAEQESLAHEPTVDISGDLKDLGDEALAQIRKRKAEGRSFPLGWAAFARVRAEQERYNDAVENFMIGRRGKDASTRIDRLIAETQAKMGAHDKAVETLSEIESAYGAEWVPDLALDLAIRARAVERIIPALLACGSTPHFFVKERCLTTVLEFRPTLKELGIDPDTGIKTGGDQPFWKSFL